MRRLNLWLAVAVAVCAASFLLGRRVFDSGPGPRDAVSRVQEAVWEGQESVQLLVLNGTRVDGLARQFGLLLGRRGLAPVGFGNAPVQNHERSILVNRRLSRASAQRLAGLLGGVPVIREFDGRGLEEAVLVLGKDHPRLRAALGTEAE